MAAKKKTVKTKKPAINPTPGYIMLKQDEVETKTESGIYLPDNSNADKPQQGKVLAVGDSEFRDGQEVKSPAKVGDTIIYKKWGGNEVKIDGEEFMFTKFEDVIAIIN